MLANVFTIMEENPLKNDWILTVKDNLRELNMDPDNLNLIKNKKIKKFKKELKIAIKKRAFEKIKKKDMSKIKNIHYKKL